jgi:transcriptional regulator with XRE-family HTH domain
VQNGRPRGLLVAWPQLADGLRQLREAADLSTRALSERLGFSQSKVSKLENGRVVPAVDDVRAWCAATGATAAQVARLAELVERTHSEAILTRAEHRAGLPDVQREVREAMRTAAVFRNYHPATVPALLQTPDYARLVLALFESDPSKLAESVAARLQNQAILFEPRRRFEFLLAESALRWRYGPIAVQLGQLDRLRTVAVLDNVLLGVLPVEQAAPVWHSCGFTLFEGREDDSDPFVHVEALNSEMNITEPDSVKEYQEVFDRLASLALTGQDAIAFLGQLMGEYEQRDGGDPA